MTFGAVAGGLVAGVAGTLVGGIMSKKSNDAAARSADAQSYLANTQGDIANEQWQRYKDTYAPLEDKYVQEAQQYDSPENYAKAAGEAAADSSLAFAKARDRLNRMPGLDPSSGSYQKNIIGLNLAQAATDATAQNAARQTVKDTAWGRKTNAISLGKNLPTQASQGLSAAANTQAGLTNYYQNKADATAAQWGAIVGNGLGKAFGVGSNVMNSGGSGGSGGGGGSIGNSGTGLFSQESLGFNNGAGWGG
jgi:hypothetical protein